jgi:hypothetical protein
VHGRVCLFRSGQWPRADVNPGRLGGNRDLLAGRGVPALALVLRGLDSHGELHQPPIRTFCASPSSSSTTSPSASSNAFGVGLGEVGTVSDTATSSKSRMT